jgi:hypothetical protein
MEVVMGTVNLVKGLMKESDESTDAKPGLLELLANQIGCVYLSELRDPQNLNVVQYVLHKIEPSFYTLNEWVDAVYYLTGKTKEFFSQEDAKSYLLGFGGGESTDEQRRIGEKKTWR